MSDTTPRTQREASQRSTNSSWLNAKSHTTIGTKSCNWNNDDRDTLFCIKLALAAFISSLIAVLLWGI